MSDYTLSAADNASAQVTLTDTHAVIVGRHLRISNGFMYKTDSNCIIERGNVLSIERLRVRSKRMLTAFIVCMGILVFVFGASQNALNRVDEIRVQLWKAEQALSSVSDGGHDLGPLEASLDNAKRAFTGFVVVCVLIAMAAAVCLALYAFRPHDLLRIAAIGVTAAVEVKYYRKEDVDYIISLWNGRKI